MSDDEKKFLAPGGDWQLIDVNDRTFSSQQLRGSYYIMFFGNTLCPDTTPLTVFKMTKAISQLKKQKESQYINCKTVFVTVKPETDKPKDLINFKNMFDSSAQLIVLRENNNRSQNLIDMMRKFKVPVGMTPEE